MTKASKRFALTTEQIKELRDAFTTAEQASDLLAEMLLKLSEKQAKKARQTWESVAELIGADRDAFTSGTAGLDARINYLTSEVIVTGTEEALDAALPHIPFRD
jgi:hypothetical protein